MTKHSQPLSDKNPAIAAALSLVPGLGHFYVGKTRKGVALLCIDAGILIAVFFSRSYVLWMMAFLIYLSVAIPASVETYRTVRSEGKSHSLDSKPYIIWVLFTAGFSALPLLWQSRLFSRRTKIAWTIAVPLLAVLFFGGLTLWGGQIDMFLKQMLEAS